MSRRSWARSLVSGVVCSTTQEAAAAATIACLVPKWLYRVDFATPDSAATASKVTVSTPPVSTRSTVASSAACRASSLRGLATSTDRSRSEEHTSELQSLMRISYAVFCLKKQIQHKYQRNYSHNNVTHYNQ